jgi:hypothetical protein
VLTVVVLGFGIMTIKYWESGLPVWGFIVVCFGMGALMIVPEGILEGTTNQRVSVLSLGAFFVLLHPLTIADSSISSPSLSRDTHGQANQLRT